MDAETIYQGAGPQDCETQPAYASATFHADQVAHCRADSHHRISLLIGSIIELHRQRVDLHKAEKSLTLQIKAKCRRLCDGDKKEAGTLYASMFNGKGHEMAETCLMAAAPFIQARSLLNEQRAACEKELTKAAKELPVWPWVESVRGFGAGSLAAIIGESGDLSQYANPAKLWKRMGLAVINGGRQRKVSGADAIEHGYAPHRRSIVWNLGDTMLKGTVRKVKDEDGEDTGGRTALNEYGQMYLERKAYERPRVESDAHAHNRAKRYMEKRLLRDLWTAWRAAE
ncbi:MAG: hypothetical protein FKY71_17890 [Spiribacter salinus]|uniref:IS110 family transposase n=1 Tax=Spiribacter salinus TaxID=1335746 RepID=A0A540VD16_9GAMM|nr:MAG: hypothetical protein FKY71_17890 [Spiribacter salinus]